ncbi:MAG TPA: twin-arginine translocase subunit TatC [Steroidobacteraceae bacterium]|nr:twin-arginine translocase subunit TatC [Steroidobacteraceae bacterium]
MSEPEPEAQEDLKEGTLISHLLELRDRLLKAVFAVAIATVPCMIFANEIFSFVSRPILALLPKGSSLIATNLTSTFTTPFKLAVWIGVFAAMPVVIYQLWAFVAPGLYKREKRFAVPLLFSSVILFYAGVAFAYYAVFPVLFGFFLTTAPQGVNVMADISSYLDFVLTLFFAFGVAFEVPVATVLLVATGLVKLKTLTGNRGYVVLAISIIAAILTPPDAVSMCLMGAPMYLLYEFGIIMTRVLVKKRDDVDETADAQAQAPQTK